MPPVFYPAEFTGDWLVSGFGDKTGYKGYTTGETWNGWATPYFTKEAVELYMKNHPEARWKFETRQGVLGVWTWDR